jgi:hypothetical protein
MSRYYYVAYSKMGIKIESSLWVCKFASLSLLHKYLDKHGINQDNGQIQAERISREKAKRLAGKYGLKNITEVIEI